MSEIVLDGVTKRFGEVRALEDVSLEVADGELVAVVGPSGCGKSTLLRIVAGLEAPTEGDVFFDGRRVTDVPARHREVALVFQDFALLPNLDVRGNLSFNLRMRGGERIDERVERTAALLGIDNLLDRNIDELSGGQKQRVALGRAIAADAIAYLLDEPFANLDSTLRERMRTELARLQDRFEVTTIHVTHDQHEAMTMGDRIVVLNDGVIQQIGTPREVYTEPATLFVARFLGTPGMNLFDATYDPDDATVSVGRDPENELRFSVEADDDTPTDIVAGVRPEDVVVGTDTDAKANEVDATIEYVEYAGADAFVYLASEGFPETVVRVDGTTDLTTWQDVRIRVDPGEVHLFDADSGRRLDCRLTREQSRPGVRERSGDQ